MWKITLADGTILDNLKLNGNNFISQTELTPANFTGKLGHVIIECTDNNPNEADLFMAGTFEHMRLDALRKYADGWYFVLNPIPDDELRLMRLEANQEYLAMMTEIDL